MPITRKGRKDIENSGYYRALASIDNDKDALELASILSENQAIVISNGNMLDSKIIPNPDFNPNNVKRKVKTINLNAKDCNGHYSHLEVMRDNCPTIQKGCIQIDYVTISDDEVCIYEIKDGDNFDTKKSEGEVESLLKVKGFFEEFLENRIVHCHVVIWNASDVSKVSFKAKDIPNDFVMLGVDFCKKNNIDWNAIKINRMSQAEANKNNLIEKLEAALARIRLNRNQQT
jgi:hypothetical protein